VVGRRARPAREERVQERDGGVGAAGVGVVKEKAELRAAKPVLDPAEG
jgi:hypothetical protein